MKASAWLWIAALLLTLVSARWQRTSGPTYPLSGRVCLGGTEAEYVLERTHAGPGDHEVHIGGFPAGVTGTVEWKPRGSQAPWTVVPMLREGTRSSPPCPTSRPAGDCGTASG